MSAEKVFDNAKFEAAINMVLDGEKHDYPAYSNGMKIASGTDLPLVSPIDSTIIFGTLQEPEAGTATLAAQAAADAFPAWSKESPEKRAAILSFVASAVESRRYRLAAEVVLSTGITPVEAFKEVDRTIEILKKAAVDTVEIKGKPTGVWGIIALISSPLASPIGYAAAALAAGNTVVIMPSGTCCRPVHSVYELFVKAGIPDGVINLVADRIDRYVTELSDDLNVSGVVASGCGQALDDMMFLMVDEGLKFYNEIKGMNPIVIAHPADIKKAASDVLESMTSGNGLGLYATSKVIILADDEREFTRVLMEKMKDLVIDDPVNEGTQMGPLLDRYMEKRYKDALDRDAAFLMAGGRKIDKDTTENGAYYSPALFVGMPEENDSMYVDQALPVLTIKTVATVEDAIADLDETDKGLAVGVMSRDSATINKVKEAAEGLAVFVNKSNRDIMPAVNAEMKNFLK
ncbi:MAG: aldehyde dehydrogenase family protein [archaeon]|nr:aldehyde dehydrogenase family protein [archaeon]